MKWAKQYQLMRIVKKIPFQTDYETVMDEDDLFKLMKIAHQLLLGAATEKVVEFEQLEIWKQEKWGTSIIANYFIYNPEFKKG